MNLVRSIFILTLLAAVAIPVGLFIQIWTESASAISRAERADVFRSIDGDRGLSVVEHSIAVAEFQLTWNERATPCRSIASIWADAEATGQSISSVLSMKILNDPKPRRFLPFQAKRVLTACQLERKYSDSQLLRAWLADAYFGVRPAGLANASRLIFGKDDVDLDPTESARLAALLRYPHLREDPEKWLERAEEIRKRVAVSNNS